MTASSSQVKVTCDCGAMFRAQQKHVGKKVRCPSCKSILTVSRPTAKKGENPNRERICPGCSAPWKLGAVLCIECGYHKDEGKKIKAKVGRRKRIDNSTVLQRTTDQILLESRVSDTSQIWVLNVMIGLGLSIVAYGLVMLFQVGNGPEGDSTMRFFGGVLALFGTALTYSFLVARLNRTTLLVNRESLRLRHAPLPTLIRWPTTIPVEQIAQLFVRERYNAQEGHAWFDVYVFTKKGRRRRIWKSPESDSADQIEQAIEDFLGIEDGDVAKFNMPHLRLIIRGAGLVLLGIFALFASASSKWGNEKEMLTAIAAAGAGLYFGYLGVNQIRFALLADRESIEEVLESGNQVD